MQRRDRSIIATALQSTSFVDGRRIFFSDIVYFDVTSLDKGCGMFYSKKSVSFRRKERSGGINN
jgi:hypothetical protein